MIKSFKIFESRTAELSEDEFKKILKSECKDFLKNPMFLQRSKTTMSSKFSFLDPTKFTRTQLKDETIGVKTKHHLLLMENLPSWDRFPRRSKSIIGVTNPSFNTSYGLHRYLVIPFDGAEFGVAPAEDLWACDTKLVKRDDELYDEIGSLEFSFDDYFSDLLHGNSISEYNYDSMIRDLQVRFEDTDINFKKSWKNSREYGKVMDNLIGFFKINGYEDIETALNNYFSPDSFKGKLSGFKLLNYNKLTDYKNFNLGNNFEFWTESPCLLFYIGKINYDTNYRSENEFNDFLIFIDSLTSII
jgi:hypothetical protein